MKIHLLYTATLNIADVPNDSDVELADGDTVADLLNRLGIPAEHHKFVLPSVNGKKQRHSTPLADGDAVCLTLPMGGG